MHFACVVRFGAVSGWIQARLGVSVRQGMAHDLEMDFNTVALYQGCDEGARAHKLGI